MRSLENSTRTRTREPSTPLVRGASPHGGVPEEDSEYEEVDDLIYERTGTLSFPYPLGIAERGLRATEAAGARPEAAGAPPAGAAAWSSLGHLVRDLRAASAGTPGVSMLATVDVGGGQPASTAKRREPSTPRSGSKADRPSSTSGPRALRASSSVPQQVVVGPALAPPPRSSVVAKRALSNVAQTIVASASHRLDPSRGREARSLAPARNAKRTTKPSLRAKERARRVYPSFGQRVLAEVRRLPLAKRCVASGLLAAVIVAGVFVASSALSPGRAPQGKVASRGGVAAVVEERAPVPAPAHVEPRVSLVVAEADPPEPPSSFINGAPPRAFEEMLPGPSPAGAPAHEVGQGDATFDGASGASNGGEYDEASLDRPGVDARLTGDRSNGAKAKARSNRRQPTHPGRHEPCDCLPGDPLCGCLD